MSPPLECSGDSNLRLHNCQPRERPLCAGSPRRLGVSIIEAITIYRERDPVNPVSTTKTPGLKLGRKR
jgi:hypothetical protein